MPELIIITEHGRSTGFRLAGFETMEVSRDEDPSVLLEELEETLLLCVDAETLSRVSQPTLKRIKKKGLPIIIPLDIPAKWNEQREAESPIVRMLRRAIGYQIKIKK